MTKMVKHVTLLLRLTKRRLHFFHLGANSSLSLFPKPKVLTSIPVPNRSRVSQMDLRNPNFSKNQRSLSKKAEEDCQQQLLVAKKDAESVAMITPALQKEFLEMPTTIEELEAAIQENISQANSILFLNQNILEEYEDRQQKIEEYAGKLEADKTELSRPVAEVDNLKGTWLPTLRSLVAQINETFSWNFQEMAVAGEVSQFHLFDIMAIRQAGQLQVLSAHHLSGGERSVSTIIYLVSLQDLTNCPFRVVDEINQGMDPINERKMFQQLVRAASQPNTPRCFLLTPKLLPDLVYSEECCALNIKTGP